MIYTHFLNKGGAVGFGARSTICDVFGLWPSAGSARLLLTVANKGVFITTSGYTAQAVEFARSVERIVLVDGPRLAELMMDNEVGVS